VNIYPLVQQQADGSVEGAAATVTVTASAAGAEATGNGAQGVVVVSGMALVVAIAGTLFPAL
jgi:hypothetical protein